MDTVLFALHVIPFELFVFGAFLLFLRPPGRVILASLAGGLVMAALNALIDLLAISASWWHYTATGLTLQLPLLFYITPLLIYGGIAYLLIWRFQYGKWRWLSLALLIGVPLIGFGRDVLTSTVTHDTFLVWNNTLAAAPVDFVMWVGMFYTGYGVFRFVVGRREQIEVETAARDHNA